MKTRLFLMAAALLAALAATTPAAAKNPHAGGRNPLAATPADPASGPGSRATPAVPGNPTAQGNVEENRPAAGEEQGDVKGKGKKKAKGHAKNKAAKTKAKGKKGPPPRHPHHDADDGHPPAEQ